MDEVLTRKDVKRLARKLNRMGVESDNTEDMLKPSGADLLTVDRHAGPENTASGTASGAPHGASGGRCGREGQRGESSQGKFPTLWA
jgi:hypothetical protein